MKIPFKNIFSIILCIFSLSCSFVTIDYSDLNTADGVNSYEAVILAQREIADTSFRHQRRVDEPDILNGTDAKRHDDYWFIVFPAKVPVVKTVQPYMVVIEKKTGNVIYKGLWDIEANPGLDWIFDNTL